MAAFLSLILALPVAGTVLAQAAVDGKDGMDERLLACAACHGAQGAGTDSDYFPRLAGKPAGYLLNQLVAFRDGRRKYAPMNYLLEFQPDDYLRKMAEYYAAQRPPLPPRPPTDAGKDVLDRGQTLVTQGNPATGVPPCGSCHGPTFTGMEPGVPGLVGLRANYISAQLGAFRYGTRTAIAPDCMQTIASSLTEADVAAVAAWLSSLPMPADPSPARKGSNAMPLACGSQPLEGGH
ncbi:c-type cytochrome [Azospirillum sp. B4]|uniref:c-type cytochrome n=1 Tax=Azospirillum sp. B4 TaxID=95605 RepID=UPI001900745F|nr:c-type cytochrome [Azospirillum sp. B4]